MNHTGYNVTGNGERECLKTCVERFISSQASEGIGSGEGSKTRRTSPNSNSVHERPAPNSMNLDVDIVCAIQRCMEIGIKSLIPVT
jgi:hypothetical protein